MIDLRIQENDHSFKVLTVVSIQVRVNFTLTLYIMELVIFRKRLTWLNKKKYLQNNGSYEDTNADITASLIEQDVILEITNVEISQTHRCYYFYR